MKKKFLMAFLTLFIACIAVINVNAKTAKAPSAVPDDGDTLYALLDSSFDFSKITFSNADGTGTIPGKSDMKKIMLTANPVMTGKTEDEVLGDSWFTVYCLDANMKFPMFNVYNFPDYPTTLDTAEAADKALAYNVMFALFNEIDLYSVFSSVVGEVFSPTSDKIYFEKPDGTTATELLNSLNNGEEITVNVTKIEYDSKTLTAADFAKDENAVNYPLTFSKEDIMMSKYTAKSLSSKNYNHSLWIIEHSYPTLDLKSSLKLAGADYDNLVTEIVGLYNGVELTEDQVSELLENYVYATIQYAIWNVNGYLYNGTDTLGDTLNNSIELNNLYQYLIKDRSEYSNYGSLTFGEDLKLNQPTEDKIIFEETKESYTYGPYSVSADFLSVGDINVSIANEVKNKANKNNKEEQNNVSTKSASVSKNDLVAVASNEIAQVSQMTSANNACNIVDKTGNVLTKVLPGQEFYVKCNKSASIANVTININTTGALTFYPTSNRARIYYSHYAAAQNVISGGKIVTKDINLNYDLIFNPKTGVENIAILFVISLIAFSLGYLVLSYKNKPVELN